MEAEGDKREKMRLSFEARLALSGKRPKSEHPKMPRHEFAELTGISAYQVGKRDRGEVAIVKGATALYQLILDLHDEDPGLVPGIIGALKAVPKDARTEGRALAALINFAEDQGKKHLASWAFGDTDAERSEDTDVGDSATTTLHAIERIKNSLRRDAMRADDADAAPLQDMAADLARVYERLQMFIETKKKRRGPAEGSE